MKAGLHVASVAEKVGLDTMDANETGLWYDKELTSITKGTISVMCILRDSYRSLWENTNINTIRGTKHYDELGIRYTCVKNELYSYLKGHNIFLK